MKYLDDGMGCSCVWCMEVVECLDARNKSGSGR